MKKQLDEMRRILDELENQRFESSLADTAPGFSGYELPQIVQEIVDDLQPALTPYEACFYWYLFRHSIARNGNALLRVSTRGMQEGVVRSSRSGKISLPQVRETLAGLERIGALRKEGEPDRDGTPYRILIPDEIEVCRKYRAERTATSPRLEVSESEIDYYNVRENRLKIYERDEYRCHYCGKQLTRFTATLDHVKPVKEGGNNSFDNLVTACLGCNSEKNARAVGDFLAERG